MMLLISLGTVPAGMAYRGLAPVTVSFGAVSPTVA